MASRKPLVLVSGLFQELNTPTDKLDFAGNTTTDLTEGTNQYFTNTRARSAISLTTTDPSPNTGLGSLTYNSSTGAFTFTQVTDSIVRGLFSATTASGITYTSSTGVFALSGIPNSSLTNSVINILDAFGNSTAVPLGNSPSYDIGPASTVIELVHNHSGATIPRGTPVAITGYASGRPAVVPADASDPAKMPAIGVTYEQIANNANGSVVALGVAKQIDTSAYTAGQTLYVGATPGTLVTTPPASQSNLIQNIGKVTEVGVNGRVLVLGPGRTNAVPNLNNGNIFLGNASNQPSIVTLNTTVVPEGTNQYFTDARARSAISVTDSGGDGSLSYNNTSGVITYTGPSASEVRAHFSVAAGSGLTYNNTTGQFGTSAIPNSQLQNSAVTIGSTSVALGSTATTITGLLSLTTSAFEATGTSTFGNNVTLNAQADLRFADSDSSNWVAFQAPATVTANVTWTLPAADGTSNQVLKTDGTGTLSWGTVGTGDVTAAGNNVFTGANTFTNTTGQIFRRSAVQDGILLRGRSGGDLSFTVELVPTTLTASRTLTLPNATGTVTLLGTTGRIPYNDTTGHATGNLGYVVADGTFGYVAGGGTVTQATSKATGVTLNTPCGQITMNAASLNADTTVSFLLTDSSIAATDVMILNHVSGGSPGSYLLQSSCANGSATIYVRNITAAALAEAIVIRFTVIASVNA